MYENENFFIDSLLIVKDDPKASKKPNKNYENANIQQNKRYFWKTSFLFLFKSLKPKLSGSQINVYFRQDLICICVT